MQNDQVRVLKIEGSAINELMWEMLNKFSEQYLDIDEPLDTILRMNWEKDKDTLVLYAIDFTDPRPIDFDAIDLYIDEHIEKTTESVFSDDPNKVPYRDISLAECCTNWLHTAHVDDVNDNKTTHIENNS